MNREKQDLEKERKKGEVPSEGEAEQERKMDVSLALMLPFRSASSDLAVRHFHTLQFTALRLEAPFFSNSITEVKCFG